MSIAKLRPEDYFAQMAKSDDHMNKVREKLVSKQATEEKLEKVRKLRNLKKFGKKVQQEVAVKRQKEKREMLDQVCSLFTSLRDCYVLRILNLITNILSIHSFKFVCSIYLGEKISKGTG